MYICRLFHRDQPFEQVDARLLAEGSLTIGRDPSADWALVDPEGVLSRIHCTLMIDGDRLLLIDSSTNGAFLDSGERAPRDEPVELGLRQSVRLGAFSILIDRPDEAARDPLATTLHLPLSAAPAVAPRDWDDALPTEPAPHRDQSLLEAFCEGARLDVSAFSGEDPAELMRRVGAIYQQTILGLATLMTERARLKGECDLERTTIGAAQNNPFKWSPTRRLAQDLLTGGAEGFLSDAAAVRASFDDLAAHLAAIARGANAATDLTLRTLSPEAIEAEAKDQGGGLLRGKAAVCWDVHARRHAALVAQDGGRPSAVTRAFGEAYGAALEDQGR